MCIIILETKESVKPQPYKWGVKRVCRVAKLLLYFSVRGIKMGNEIYICSIINQYVEYLRNFDIIPFMTEEIL
jgi:hypothetical protein